MQNINEYQLASQRTIPEDQTRKELLTNFSMGLAGEAGEVVDALKKHLFHGHELDREELVKELGDTLFYLTGIATIMGVPMDEVTAKNFAKLSARYPEGFDQLKSINRIENQ